MSLKTDGFCVSCGKQVKGTYKYCYKCNVSTDKVKCQGWFNKPCPNLTTNEIHRCIEHCLNFCCEESTGKRKSTLRHLVDECCTPKNCWKCGKVLFYKYNCCFKCHTNKDKIDNKAENKTEKYVATSQYEFIDDSDDEQ